MESQERSIWLTDVPRKRENRGMLGWDGIDSGRWTQFGSLERQRGETKRWSDESKKTKARRFNGNTPKKMNIGLDQKKDNIRDELT